MLGRFTLAQVESLRPFVEGKEVHDLGAGRLEQARMLYYDLGARRVIAVDKEPFEDTVPEGVTIVTEHFDGYDAEIPVAFVSWPVNWDSGLHALLERAPVVIYVGKNTDMTSCGYAEMWKGLVAREVLAHHPERRNTIIVYGPQRLVRPGLPEEYAAIHSDSLWSYNAIHMSFDMGDLAGVNASLAPSPKLSDYTDQKSARYRELYGKRQRRRG